MWRQCRFGFGAAITMDDLLFLSPFMASPPWTAQQPIDFNSLFKPQGTK